MINAGNADELLERLAAIDIAVPLRSERRTSEHVQRWSTARFLSTFANSGLFAFPIRVIPRDRPDVLLEMATARAGIEITEGVPANWAKVSALHEDREYENVMFIPRCKPGEPDRATRELERIARGEDMGSGWAGDGPEREWADAMLYFAKFKAEKSKKPGFEWFEKNWLLIYDNWPLPALEEAKAAAYLSEKLAVTVLPFDTIFVEGKEHFWRFEGAQFEDLRINELWRQG